MFYIFFLFFLFASLTANNFCYSGTEAARYRTTRSTRLHNLFASLLIFDFTQWTAETRFFGKVDHPFVQFSQGRALSRERKKYNTWTIIPVREDVLSPPERSADGQTETTFYLGTWCRLVRECIKGVLFL